MRKLLAEGREGLKYILQQQN